uniref:C-type lectin domain-containing protein n=1 Tax=Plectus sambesii TaxID=2011161 RepID=A0A914VCZ8_9BILA
MARTSFAHFVAINILQLSLLYNSGLHAVDLSYEGCMSDTANSYTVGGWCFLLYRDSSWGTIKPTQDDAQTLCGAKGNLAVGVTTKMLNTFKTNYASASLSWRWIALVRNSSISDINLGWSWNTRLPSGKYATFPAIMSDFPWGPGEPGNQFGSENSASISYNEGICDVRNDWNRNPITRIHGVICQYAPLQWKYSQRGHGLFAVDAYRIAQTTAPKLACIMQCHHSVFCISLAFNPTTSDCQIYGVSPEDPKFAGNVTGNSAYDWYIRDGMEY